MQKFEYKYIEDLQAVKELLNVNDEELSRMLNISRKTLSSWLNGHFVPSKDNLEKIYELIYNKGIYINKIKEQFFKEEVNNLLLFHGAKEEIYGELSLEKSKKNNDFGPGFYIGQSLEQSITYVANYENSSIYFVEFDPSNLNYLKYDVNKDWMLTIAYFRGRLGQYKNNPKISELINRLENVDYIIAPIADNNMYLIMDNFFEGEITDEQCNHCLAATNLGYQYVLLTEKALKQAKILEKGYLCISEKDEYVSIRKKQHEINKDKVKLSRIKYRGKGQYIDEIL